MDSDNRIIELLSDMLVEQKKTNERLEKVELGIIRLDEQQAKTNLAIGELRLSVMKLADRLEIIDDHEKRIDKLEHAVFHS